jgi:hypothetical protein
LVAAVVAAEMLVVAAVQVVMSIPLFLKQLVEHLLKEPLV